MFNYFLFVALIGFLYAYEPSCTTCKFFIPNLQKPELGLCKMFQDKIYVNNRARLVKNLALHCRSNENLCGKKGFLYQQINIDNRFEYYEYIESLCCGELSEEKDLKELEEIERDLFNVFKKMKKHNTRSGNKTINELFNLHKNKNK
jgi:hypothetical protein